MLPVNSGPKDNIKNCCGAETNFTQKGTFSTYIMARSIPVRVSFRSPRYRPKQNMRNVYPNRHIAMDHSLLNKL